MGDDEVMTKALMTPNYTKDVCKTLASSLNHVAQLPTECTMFPDVVHDIKRKETDKTHGASYLG